MVDKKIQINFQNNQRIRVHVVLYNLYQIKTGKKILAGAAETRTKCLTDSTDRFIYI
jgi:hypothetical protein